MRAALFSSIAAGLLAATAVFAQQSIPNAAQEPTVPGYLAPAEVPEASLILPPAPVEGKDRYATDRAVFKASRSLKDGERWRLAQADDDYTTPYLLRAFSCAMGVKLSPETTPALMRMIPRTIVDDNNASRAAKAIFQRKRPYLIDEGDICIAKTQALADSFDYPSGHTTLGWATGLILAQISPERSTAVLTRARSYGESRVVCGVHNSSAIEAGRTTGATVVAALNGNPAFLADLAAAKAEVSAARANPAAAVDPAICTTEAALIAKTPYPQ